MYCTKSSAEERCQNCDKLIKLTRKKKKKKILLKDFYENLVFISILKNPYTREKIFKVNYKIESEKLI